MNLIGEVYQTGRVDFSRQENPWAFQRIDSGMRNNQRDRIRVDPSQVSLTLRSAAINGPQDPVWRLPLEATLQTADSLYLQFKGDVLRFRRAIHETTKNRSLVTLGTQEECQLFAQEHWQRIRYLFATRRESAFCFDVQTLFSLRSGSPDPPNRVELDLRMDLQHANGQPQLSFDATGSAAPLEVIEWRSTVREGESGRFAPEHSRIQISVRNISRPYTVMIEPRPEFKSNAYTLAGEKVKPLLDREIKSRLKERQQAVADAAKQR